jgi:hypothetical protein
MVPQVAAAPVAVEDGHARRRFGDGTVLDWTSLELEASVRVSNSLSKMDNKPAEQEAMTRIDELMAELLGRVPVAPGLLLQEARADGLFVSASAWSVVETRYYAAGAVEVVGRAPILPLISGWQHARALVPVAAEPRAEIAGPTGLVIDARGTPVQPVLAPHVVDETGTILVDGVLSRDVAFSRSPVTWVGSAVALQAQVAGDRPVFARAVGGGMGTIVLGPEGAAAVRAVHDRKFLRAGAVVVVVDADG